MAITMPLLGRKRVLLAKAETTTGTAETLTGAEGAFNIFEPALNYADEFVEREGQGSLSPLTGIAADRKATAAFTTHLQGNAGSGGMAWADTFLKACGFTADGAVYTPTSTTSLWQTLTIAHNISGRRKSLSGALGNLTLTAKSGQPVQMKWNFSGVSQPMADEVQLTPTYPTVKPPLFAGATFTIGGTSYKISSMEIDLGNQVVMREDVTALDSASVGTGYISAFIASRKITVKIDPEASLLATKNWRAIFLANTTAALNCVIGTAAGNTVTITAPALQLMAPPQDADRNGILIENLTFLATISGSTADSELVITTS